MPRCGRKGRWDQLSRSTLDLIDIGKAIVHKGEEVAAQALGQVEDLRKEEG